VIYQTKSGQKQQIFLLLVTFFTLQWNNNYPQRAPGGKNKSPPTPEPAPILTASFQLINNESKGVKNSNYNNYLFIKKITTHDFFKL